MFNIRENIKILLLEDSPTQAEFMAEFLRHNEYSTPLLLSDDKISFIKQLNESNPDVILCDHVLPAFNSLEAYKIAKEKNSDIIFIVLSGYITNDFGVELLKIGVDDYFLKSEMFRLPFVIESQYYKNFYKKESDKLELINKELQNAYKIIEDKNTSVTQSIIFAERIQTLTLPKIDILLKNFPESFILYKPKDIVSGDFYWFSNNGDWTVVVVADCTGHGVSGALLAMLGSNLLNEIIENDKNFKSPTDILTKLDMGICNLLKQNLNNGYQDGIDLGLVSINKKEKKIYFCGSKRSLLFLVKEEKKILTYKGNPYLVGGNYPQTNKNFTTQEINYKSGDIIYMYTDGYVDQFGGDNNKKLMKDHFIDSLLSFQHLELNFQSQLLEQKLIEWQGECEQTDDILVVGIKL